MKVVLDTNLKTNRYCIAAIAKLVESMKNLYKLQKDYSNLGLTLYDKKTPDIRFSAEMTSLGNQFKLEVSFGNIKTNTESHKILALSYIFIGSILELLKEQKIEFSYNNKESDVFNIRLCEQWGRWWLYTHYLPELAKEENQKPAVFI